MVLLTPSSQKQILQQRETFLNIYLYIYLCKMSVNISKFILPARKVSLEGP